MSTSEQAKVSLQSLSKEVGSLKNNHKLPNTSQNEITSVYAAIKDMMETCNKHSEKRDLQVQMASLGDLPNI